HETYGSAGWTKSRTICATNHDLVDWARSCSARLPSPATVAASASPPQIRRQLGAPVDANEVSDGPADTVNWAWLIAFVVVGAIATAALLVIGHGVTHKASGHPRSV